MRTPLILSLLLLLFSGCQPPAAAPVESASPEPPIQTATAPPVDQSAAALESVRAWKTADQAWAKVHPEVLAKAQEGDKARILGFFTSSLKMGDSSSKKLRIVPTTARQSPRENFPVFPTHDVVIGDLQLPIFHLKIEEAEWHLCPSLPTEAAALAAKEPQKTPEEQKALALKVLESLSPEQIAMLNEKILEENKIRAIKALRDIDAHGLAIQKLAIEILMERQKN